jgi:hypothetical protein
MDTSISSESDPFVQDDRILLQTRLVLIVVVPFLLLAFLILYFFPDLSGERFAWGIKPHMTALFIGSGYLGGAYMFIFAIFGKRWHRIKAAFPPVTTFTVAMMLATVIHWDRFDLHHFPFQLWLFLYIVTPFIVPYLWIKNRIRRDRYRYGDFYVHLSSDHDSHLALGSVPVDRSYPGRLVWIIGRWWFLCRARLPLERLADAATKYHILGHPDFDWGVHKSDRLHKWTVESVHDWDGCCYRCIGRLPGWDGNSS